MLKLTPAHSRRVISCPVRPCHWDWVFDTCSIAWSGRTGQLAACVVASVWRYRLQSTIIYQFLCGFICVSLYQSIKIKTQNMYTTRARAKFEINTHSFEVDTCAFQAVWYLFSVTSAMSLALCIWHNCGGMKRTCWKAGIWGCGLSLEFNPSWVHDSLSAPFGVYMHFPLTKHQTQTDMYTCSIMINIVLAGMYFICMCVCFYDIYIIDQGFILSHDERGRTLLKLVIE